MTTADNSVTIADAALEAASDNTSAAYHETTTGARPMTTTRRKANRHAATNRGRDASDAATHMMRPRDAGTINLQEEMTIRLREARIDRITADTGRPFGEGGAYCSDNFVEWRAVVGAIVNEGFTDDECVTILRSTWMRAWRDGCCESHEFHSMECIVVSIRALDHSAVAKLTARSLGRAVPAAAPSVATISVAPPANTQTVAADLPADHLVLIRAGDLAAVRALAVKHGILDEMRALNIVVHDVITTGRTVD